MRTLVLVIVASACATRPPPPHRHAPAPAAVPPSSERCYAGTIETVHDQTMRVHLRWRLDPALGQLTEEWIDTRKTATVYRVVIDGDRARAIAPSGDVGELDGQPWGWTGFVTRGGRHRLVFRGTKVTGGARNATSLELVEIDCAVYREVRGSAS